MGRTLPGRRWLPAGLLLILSLLDHECLASNGHVRDEANSDGVTAESEVCQSEADLNFDTCKLEDLPKHALIAICDRIGLDMEQHVFPLLDLDVLVDDEDADNVENDDGDSGESEDETASGQHYGATGERKGIMKERDHADYVQATRECLLVEAEVDRMEEDAPDELEDLERSMLAEDPGLLAEVVKDVLDRNPTLSAELEAELKEKEPALFQDMMKVLAQDETLADQPELLADLVSLMLAETDSLNVGRVLDSLDEDIVAHIQRKSEVGSDAESDEEDKKDEL